jgi:DNA ligase (NAD+)
VQKVEMINGENGRCVGQTFVITGDVHHFKNRDAFKAYVEAEGGKVAGSVSGKTSYLVNNDVNSTSGKNKKAKELDVKIISENELIEMMK